MPFSVRENNDDVLSFVKTHEIKTVLDVGPGAGTYGRILRQQGYVTRMDAVEAWEPYVEGFNLRSIYNEVSVFDIRDLVTRYDGVDSAIRYDLIIFGDVLEHMTKEEALSCWNWASNWANWGLISVPIVHWPQHVAEGGNPYEEHIQEHMRPEEIRKDYGPFYFDREYEVTGTFIKRFQS